MKRYILILRVLATLFLVGILITYTRTDSGWTDQDSISILSFQFTCDIGGESTSIRLSSDIVGFALSLIATILSIRLLGSVRPFIWPLVWSTLAMLSYANEITRIFSNHFQVLLLFPPLQVAADWLSMRHLKHAIEKECPNNSFQATAGSRA